MKTRYAIYVVVASVLLLSSCQKPDPEAATRAKNKAAMQAINDAFASGNVDALDKYIAADYVEHSPDPMMKGTGLAALKSMASMMHTMYPDMKSTIDFMIAEGDLVTAHFTMTGTNSGSVEGMPATNKTINVEGVDIARFKEGVGVEHWGYFDVMKMMQQLGMMPPPGETAKAPEKK
jgi:steroid delta-isomerase-like uncharacterized protein